jgi:hypothetical protein
MSRTVLAALVAVALLCLVAAPGGTTRTATADVDVDVGVFFEGLAPHGDWFPVEPYGWVWAPDVVDYSWRPYTVGWWAWVEPYGWTWISEEEFGWAVYHYGRWVHLEDFGWVWVPGATWAPAWVQFRFGDGWVGWAPRPPEPGWRLDLAFDARAWNVEFGVGTYAWTFVPVRWFAGPDVRARRVAAVHNPAILRRTSPSTRFALADGRVVNRSIDLQDVERARGRPVPRHRIADAPRRGRPAVQGDVVTAFRPRVAPRLPSAPPARRPRNAPPGRPGADGAAGLDLDAWADERRKALEAHLEGQRRAAERDPGTDAEPPRRTPQPGGPPAPPPAMDPQEVERRREATRGAIEEERRRHERVLERQRKRMEEEMRRRREPEPPPPMQGGEGRGQGQGQGMR